MRFPFISTIILFIILPVISEISFASYVYYKKVVPEIEKREKEIAVLEEIERDKAFQYKNHDFLLWNIYRNYYQLRKKDQDRFYDCEWHAPNTDLKPFYALPYLKYFNSFESKGDIFCGLAIINDSPSLLYARNINNYNHQKSKIILQVRGSDFGIHKSNLPSEILKLQQRNKYFENDLLCGPDNFIFVEPYNNDVTSSDVQAICHNRMYRGNRWVSNYWEFFNKGKFWDMYDKVFTNPDGVVNENLWIFGYSNGSTPMSQLLKMRRNKEKDCNWEDIEDGRKKLIEYTRCHELADRRSLRIKTVVDIETLYGISEILPLAMFAKQNIEGYKDRYLYATCGSDDCFISSHILLISVLDLHSHPVHSGKRYTNKEGNIVVDILDPSISGLSHSSIIPYTIKEFEKIIKY